MTTEETVSELMTALIIAREYILKIDASLASIPAENRVTRKDLFTIEAALLQGEAWRNEHDD